MTIAQLCRFFGSSSIAARRRAIAVISGLAGLIVFANLILTRSVPVSAHLVSNSTAALLLGGINAGGCGIAAGAAGAVFALAAAGATITFGASLLIAAAFEGGALYCLL